MKRRKALPFMKTLLFVTTAALAGQLSLSAQTLFSDNFDTDTSASWTVNNSGGNNAATFLFDYSTVGIPSAPNSGGSTLGLKMEANYGAVGVYGGISVSPNGQNFTGDYVLRFDLWQNYVGNRTTGGITSGGNGSTQMTGAGIGTAGTTPQWQGGAHDSVHFGATGDGGATVDYRAFSTVTGSDTNGYAAASGVYAAGTASTVRNSSNTYYAGFGGEGAPAEQIALYPQQTNTTSIGSQGFQWHDVAIMKLGNTITYTIDGTLIATVDASTVTLGGGNILLNHSDINIGSSSDPQVRELLFGLFDNVRVEVVPEPSTLALGAFGLGALYLLRRRQK